MRRLLRLFIFAVFTCVLLIALPLGIVELALRLSGFGYDPDFLQEAELDGRPVWIANNDFSRLFFPEKLKRVAFPVLMEKERGAHVVRIAVLGGSAANGDPNPVFSPSRVLEVMLEATYPDLDFQVINAALTACNSHVLKAVLADLAEEEIDLFIVMVGNNEVIGPYGPGTVLTQSSGSARLSSIQTWIRHWKLGQVAQWAGERLAGNSEDLKEWAGMQHFLGHTYPLGHPALDVVYRALDDNLDTLQEHAEAGNKAILFSTVPVNLRDQSPFASEPIESHAAEAALQQALDALRAGDATTALAAAETACDAAPRHAAAHYIRGKALIAVNDPVTAGEAFTMARDLDTLRFRADTAINAVIRERSADALFADPVPALAAASPHGITGGEMLFEHVHFRIRGTYHLCDAWMQPLQTWLKAAHPGTRVQEDPYSFDSVRAQLAYTAFEHYLTLQTLEARFSTPPFSETFDAAARNAALQAELEGVLNFVSKAENKSLMQQQYLQALKARPEDWLLYYQYARFLTRNGRHDAALEAFSEAASRMPFSDALFFDWASAASAANQPAQAKDLLDQVRKLNPSHPGLN